MNRFSKLCALCAALLMSITAFAGDLSNYQLPDWNDYEITFSAPNNDWNSYTNYFTTTLQPGATTEFNATVTVDGDATLCFSNGNNQKFNCQVRVDGEVVANYNTYDMGTYFKRFFVELEAGTHVVTWTIINERSDRNWVDLREIGVEKTPTITVSLLEPGSLGTEILKQTDWLQNVRKLVIKGDMNSDDWAKIDMMKDNLFVLDMGEAKTTSIPNSCFSGVRFLHTIVLPEGLLSIGDYAFNESNLVNVNFPSTLTTLGYRAFRETCIREAIMNDNCTNWGGLTFESCKSLRYVKLPANLKVIPHNAFAYIEQVDMTLPEGLTTIEEGAFYGCNSFHPVLPSTLRTIGKNAFCWVNRNEPILESISIPESISEIGANAFDNSGFSSFEFPVSFYALTGSCIVSQFTKTIRLKSPTVVSANNSIIDKASKPNITLQVPDYLVSSYKLDNYWYEFGKIEGFSTEEVDNWIINSDLILGAQDRLRGTPSIKLRTGGSLKINGTDEMPINNLCVECDPDNKAYGQIFSSAEGVTVANNLHIGFRAGSQNRWYYLCLPYNVKVSDMVFTNNNPKRAIRYYDGANRAANGTGSNWKNFGADDIIPAGTGFIFNVSEAGWWDFPSLDDESKQYITSTQMFVKELAENPSETASNRGWNLVGNPYQCWYNIHKLNFTAPITVRNASYNGYAAYSIIDDDYALAPNQAFFVQCPEGTTEISFPLNGRQMTSEITSQNGVRPRYAQASERKLADVTLSAGGMSDRTRVVLNETASMGYEVECDASKFMGDAGVAQLYTLDDEGTMYAINERPTAEGMVSMGMSIPAAGTYTLSLTRNTAGNVYVVDNLTGETVNLNNGDYSFYAEAGANVERFCLKFGTATSINAVAGNTTQASGVYTIAGAYMGHSIKGLPAGTYIIKSGAKVDKVVIR